MLIPKLLPSLNIVNFNDATLLLYSSLYFKLNFRCICKVIWDMECECIRCWINERVTYLSHISSIYHAVHSIMELKKTSLLCWNTKLHAAFYTSRSKFICFPYSIYPYRSSTIWIWKYATIITTTVTSTVFIKLTLRFVTLMFSCCCWWLRWIRDARMSVISR